MLHGGVKQEQEEEEEEEEEEEVRVENSLSLGVHVRPDGPRWSPRAGAFLCTHTEKNLPPRKVSYLSSRTGSPPGRTRTRRCVAEALPCVVIPPGAFFPLKRRNSIVRPACHRRAQGGNPAELRGGGGGTRQQNRHHTETTWSSL